MATNAGLKVFPISPLQRERKEKLKAQRELLPLMGDLIEEMASKLPETPNLKGKSKFASKMGRMKELCEKLK